MPTPLAITVFYTIWWVALFAVLPFAAFSPHGTGDSQEGASPPGVEPGAPIAPRLARVVIWTTVVAAGVFIVVDAFVFWMA